MNWNTNLKLHFVGR